MLLAVRDPRLHTPMYYFLCHLALVDAGFTTSLAPALLASLCGAELWLQRAGCLTQLCTSLAMGSVECLLLAVMALDRAAAVVHPLRHAELASPSRCRTLSGLRPLRPHCWPLSRCAPPPGWTTSSASCPRSAAVLWWRPQ